MFEGWSDIEIISLFLTMAGSFLILIGFLIKVVTSLYIRTVEKAIDAQSTLINQKIDLTHAVVMSNIMGIKEDNEEVRQIAVTAHHAVDSHVLNYHRQG